VKKNSNSAFKGLNRRKLHPAIRLWRKAPLIAILTIVTVGTLPVGYYSGFYMSEIRLSSIPLLLKGWGVRSGITLTGKLRERVPKPWEHVIIQEKILDWFQKVNLVALHH
jgi:hypothetical protein